MLDFTQQAVAVKFQIDGVWHEAEPRDRESGDVTLAVAKTLAALNPRERRKPQAGKFAAEYEGNKYTCELQSQATKVGERAIIFLAGKKVEIGSLEEAGMRPKMIEQLQEVMGDNEGILLISSMPAGGMTTALSLTLKTQDRYMRDFLGLQEASSHEVEVENVTMETYDTSQQETAAGKLPAIFRKTPHVIVIPDLVDAKTVTMLCGQAQEGSHIISTVRAKEAVEALLRVLMLKVPADTFAPAAKGVLNVRLIRKLCESCKVAVAPNPDLLKKLRLPADRVKAFYRPPPPPEKPEDICEICRGIGYFGRIGVFELLQVNDHLREALIKQPKLEVLRQIARKTGHRNLQDEGLALVVRGVTSLQEWQRALK